MQITFDNVNGNDELYMDCLRAICGDTEGKSMADLCCNLAPHTPKLGYGKRVYVDINRRELNIPQEQPYFVCMDVIEFLDKKKRYDHIICSDGIEHFTKERGYELMYSIESKCDKAIFFTPLGEYMVDDTDNPEGHHSGWMPEDFSGYASIVFKKYHPTLGVGAFFVWASTDIKEDFERVTKELKTKQWAKELRVSQ